MHCKFVLAVMLAISLCAPTVLLAQTPPTASSPSESSGSAAPLEQLPPTPPDVTYSQGQLKISAHNSTLRDVLAMVRSRTGVAIEGPVNQANDRVVVELGPAPVGDVLRQLLEGSKFDYIILGNAGKPGVERVILSLRGPVPAQATAQAAVPEAPPEEPPEEPAVDEPTGIRTPTRAGHAS